MNNNFVNTKSNNKVFFDSNIFVYTGDSSNPEKSEIAKKLLESVANEGNGIISTQNLQEFYNASTKKLHRDKNTVKLDIEDYSSIFPVVQVSIPIILKAIDIQIKYQLGFYDSLIISTASYENCVVCYSEDLTDGQIVDGVKVINPFCA
ncbi:PIN domain-containing protein [Treponema sp.]|uniref:PIN domain-containing protein n=1 Tax=Treponema sp. TaxID=166 RepID=UPI00298EB078|nr:PIN domain-containing protein [Treponema sp.]MCQ2241697.1 PIN domain-containing protein [Treponema sp.]